METHEPDSSAKRLVNVLAAAAPAQNKQDIFQQDVLQGPCFSTALQATFMYQSAQANCSPLKHQLATLKKCVEAGKIPKEATLTSEHTPSAKGLANG